MITDYKAWHNSENPTFHLKYSSKKARENRQDRVKGKILKFFMEECQLISVEGMVERENCCSAVHFIITEKGEPR